MADDDTMYDDGEMRAAHSTKGASSAERWMNCEGSTALIEALDLPDTDEEDFRREGIAGHEAAADCLARDIDTWEIIGENYHNTVIDGGMADAIQIYLDRVRPSIGADRTRDFHGKQFFIEAKLSAPDVHEKMFGSVDFAAMVTKLQPIPLGYSIPKPLPFLDVTDLKMGEGIIVDPDDNPQMKYYAFMIIHTHYDELDDDFPVRLTIVQPRAFSHDGPIRDWWTTVGEIKAWVVRDLLPAMHNTGNGLDAGKWCRFCPAKLVCPLVEGLFNAASNYDPARIIDLTDASLGLSYQKMEAVKFYQKALEAEVFRRLSAGKAIPQTKLVNKKANRVYKSTVTVQVEGKDVEISVEAAIRAEFGDKAFDPPSLKSPPELEKLGPRGKEFVKEHAYMPVTGLTVALEGDKRTGIRVQTAQERFGAALANIIEGD